MVGVAGTVCSTSRGYARCTVQLLAGAPIVTLDMPAAAGVPGHREMRQADGQNPAAYCASAAPGSGSQKLATSPTR